MAALDNFMSMYRKVSPAEAPALFEKLHELAAKAGVAVPDVHFQIPERFAFHPQKAMMDYLIAVVPENRGLIVGDKILELFGAKNPSAPISKEFSAIIAHELGHVKFNDLGAFGPKKIGRYSPLAGLLLGVGALVIFEHYHKKRKKSDSPNHESHAISSQGALPGEKEYSHEQEVKEKEHPLGWLITTAKYIAAAAIGLTTGVFVMRACNHHMESRADKFAVTLMGSSEPIKNALTMQRCFCT